MGSPKPRKDLTTVTLTVYCETNVTQLSHDLPADMTQQAPADRLPIPRPSRRRWLLFIHQLPSHPSNLRVTTWRRLQQIGAIPLKQAVYALPDTPDAREDFEWLKTEVKAAGGDATEAVLQRCAKPFACGFFVVNNEQGRFHQFADSQSVTR